MTNRVLVLGATGVALALLAGCAGSNTPAGEVSTSASQAPATVAAPTPPAGENTYLELTGTASSASIQIDMWPDPL